MANRQRSGAGKSGHAALTTALSSREVPQILNGVLDRIDEDRKEELRLEAKRSREEMEMLAADLKRLVEKHGKDHPRVNAVQMAAASLERQMKLAEATVRRIETVQIPERGGWTASGQVRDENGVPLAEVTVEFATSGGTSPEMQTTDTDGEGEFYVTYPAKIVKNLIEKETRLFLVVRKGRTVLYRDSEPFTVQPNAIRQFRVRLQSRKPGQEKR